jgi:hypothetical protein
VRQTIEIERRVLGPKHSDTLITLEVLGHFLEAENRNSKAEKVDREVFEGQRQALGMDHPDTADSAYKPGRILALQGKWDEALSSLRFAVEHALSDEYRLELEKTDDLKFFHGDPRFEAILETCLLARRRSKIKIILRTVGRKMSTLISPAAKTAYAG